MIVKHYSAENFLGVIASEKPDDIVQGYILDLFPFCFKDSPEKFWLLRKSICEEFRLHPKNFAIAGSGKLGFSIVPSKYGQPFSEASDIDVVLVSETLFDSIWRELIIYYEHPDFKLLPSNIRKEFNALRQKLFYGQVRLDILVKNFDFAKEWWKFFNKISTDETFGPREINAAIFKSCDHVTEYYKRAIVDLMERGVPKT